MSIIVPDASMVCNGEQFLRAYQSQKALLSLGNATELKIQHTEEQKTLPNYMTGVGNRNSFTRVTAVTASFTIYDVNTANLALVGRGTIRGVAAGVVTDEVQVCEAVAGELIVFDNLPDMSAPITVKTAADVELTPGEDYLVTAHGIRLTGGTAATSAGLKVSYTKLKADVVEMLTTAQADLEMYFQGFNAAQNGAPMSARLRRFKPGLVQEISLSGTEYAAYQVTGELLADPLVTEPGMSQFYSLGMKAAA